MILKNTLFNVLGLGIPLLVAVFTIPFLIKDLGAARFGLLALAWVIVSFSGMFDLGLGRALTLRMVIAARHGEVDQIGPAAATALAVMAALGACVGGLMIAGAGQAIDLVAGIPDREEAIAALVSLGIAIPAITLTAGFRGMLEARHAFGIVNLIRLPMGVYTFVGPLLTLWLFEPRLDLIAWVLVAGRYAGLCAHAFFAIRTLPLNHGPFRFRKKFLVPLLSTGGWLTVSNVVGPLIAHADRFVVGALLSATAVAYYATPYEIVSKLWIIPGALTAVLFPTFAGLTARSADAGAALIRESVAILALAMLPICAFLCLFANEILELWIDADFARHSAPLLQIFAIGVFVNALATIPYTFVQAAGRPKWTAIIHLAQIVPFFVILHWATLNFGLAGAGFVSIMRIIIDTVAMFVLAALAAKIPARAAIPEGALTLFLLVGASAGLWFVEPWGLRFIGFGLVACACAWSLWRLPAVRRGLDRARARRTKTAHS